MGTGGGGCKVLWQRSMCGRWRGASASAGWRVWDLGNGTIMLKMLFNPEWQITSKSFLLSTFLIGFSFSPTAEISRLELEFEVSLPRKTASIFKKGMDRSQMEQPIKKNKFSYLPDLAFGFVHMRSGNEISIHTTCWLKIKEKALWYWNLNKSVKTKTRWNVVNNTKIELEMHSNQRLSI